MLPLGLLHHHRTQWTCLQRACCVPTGFAAGLLALMPSAAGAVRLVELTRHWQLTRTGMCEERR